MFSARSDLPLERDALGRFLPWLIAFMVYLAALALAGVLVLNAVVTRWDQGMAGILTVQMVPEGKGADTARIEAAVAVLMDTPGVIHANALGTERVAALLEPWLGTTGGLSDLPLPILIDVQLVPGSHVDLETLGDRLATAVPGTTVDDHRVWLDRLLRLIRVVEVLAGVILALIGVACIGTVVFTTRTGMAIHREAIEVLHLIGAQDTYVASQFAGRALSLGMKGGGLGLLLAIPTLAGIGYLARNLGSGMLPDFTLDVVHWAALGALPVAAAVISMVTARLTVLGTLRRML